MVGSENKTILLTVDKVWSWYEFEASLVTIDKVWSGLGMGLAQYLLLRCDLGMRLA